MDKGLTPNRIRELVRYEPDTGKFFWVSQTSHRIKIGSEAGSRHKSIGYVYICLDGCRYLAHRLAWFWMNGAFPDSCLDHINACRDDNRIENLRCVTEQGNRQNIRKAFKNSKSGVLGVHKNSRADNWLARITVDGRSRHIGTFATSESAHLAYVTTKRALHGTCSI